MFVKLTDGQIEAYPYSLHTLRLSTQEKSFPEFIPEAELATYGIFPVTPTEPPAPGPFERVVEMPPSIVGGVWTQHWGTQSFSADEAEALYTARRLDKRSRVKALRDSKETETANTPHGVVDTDPVSSKRLLGLQGAALTSLLTGAPWTPVEWTMADNSQYLVDTPVKALELCSGPLTHAAALHACATAFKEQIDALVYDPADPDGSLAALEAIDIDTGWPA